jgi:hypothetical protein
VSIEGLTRPIDDQYEDVQSALVADSLADNITFPPGDANLDGRFDQQDLIQVFQAGKYETGQPATLSEGDFDGDGRFDSSDLVAAMQAGTYLSVPLAAQGGNGGGKPGGGGGGAGDNTCDSSVEACSHPFTSAEHLEGIVSGGPYENVTMREANTSEELHHDILHVRTSNTQKMTLALPDSLVGKHPVDAFKGDIGGIDCSGPHRFADVTRAADGTLTTAEDEGSIYRMAVGTEVFGSSVFYCTDKGGRQGWFIDWENDSVSITHPSANEWRFTTAGSTETLNAYFTMVVDGELRLMTGNSGEYCVVQQLGQRNAANCVDHPFAAPIALIAVE